MSSSSVRNFGRTGASWMHATGTGTSIDVGRVITWLGPQPAASSTRMALALRAPTHYFLDLLPRAVTTIGAWRRLPAP